MKIVMLGAPGAGKGTQAERIADKYQIPHISTGDIFRANIKAGTELGKKAKSYMDQGLLVPDSLTVDLSLKKALSDKGEALDFAVNVDVPDENIVARMSGRRACPKCGATYHIAYAAPKKEGVCDKCGAELILRDDDKPETVANRLKVYHDQTQPLIDYYTKENILHTVDGTQDMEKVFADIVKILGA